MRGIGSTPNPGARCKRYRNTFANTIMISVIAKPSASDEVTIILSAAAKARRSVGAALHKMRQPWQNRTFIERTRITEFAELIAGVNFLCGVSEHRSRD